MPILKSAKKALRQSERRRVLNLRYKKRIKDTIKQIKKLIAEKKFKEARELLPQAYKALDKAAKHGTIKKNTASRKKSRLTALLNKTEKQAAGTEATN